LTGKYGRLSNIRLSLNPNTILRRIRDGRSRATRIGKAWWILASDLDAFAGAPAAAEELGPAPVRVTAIADLTGVSMETSRRIATALQATLVAPAARPRPIQLDAVHEPGRETLKAVIIADAPDAAVLLQTLHALSEAFR